MLKLYSSNLQIDPDVDLQELARLSEGFSGSDIRDVCQSAQLSLIGEFFESGKAMDKEAKPRSLTMADFRQILEERKPSVSLDMLSMYNRWFEAFKAYSYGRQKQDKKRVGWKGLETQLIFYALPSPPSIISKPHNPIKPLQVESNQIVN